jgi:inhibitor of KinA
MENETYTRTRYLPFGDSALLVELGNRISPEINQKVINMENAILKARLQGVEELVPTYRSLLIRYDPLVTNHEQLISQVEELGQVLETPSAGVERRGITVPVVYGGEYGQDLAYVAEHHGLTEEQVIKLHSGKVYRVYMIGFVAGFPYLGEVPEEIATPRLETPRLRVPAGSVGIAEKQTGVYPCEAPGGWRIIGRTPLRLFDPFREPPALLETGDRVKFKPISKGDYEELSRDH